MLEADPVLKKRWISAPVPPPATAIISKGADDGISEALALEERRLKEGVQSLGMTPRAQSLAVTCQQFYRKNAGQIHQMTSGGIVKAFFDTLAEIEEITRQLDQKDWPDDQRLSYESILREDRARLLSFIKDCGNLVNNNVRIQAQIQKMFGDDKGKGSAKPGFGAKPLQKAED